MVKHETSRTWETDALHSHVQTPSPEKTGTWIEVDRNDRYLAGGKKRRRGDCGATRKAGTELTCSYTQARVWLFFYVFTRHSLVVFLLLFFFAHSQAWWTYVLWSGVAHIFIPSVTPLYAISYSCIPVSIWLVILGQCRALPAPSSGVADVWMRFICNYLSEIRPLQPLWRDNSPSVLIKDRHPQFNRKGHFRDINRINHLSCNVFAKKNFKRSIID